MSQRRAGELAPAGPTRRSVLKGAAAVAASSLWPHWARAEASVVRLGMSVALSGPAKDLGEEVRVGVEAGIAAVNAAGGVHGRSLELVVLDDGYEPAFAAANMHALIDEYDVFAVIGNTGTPTAAVTVPIANARRVPLVAPVTGAPLLRRSPPDRYVVNLRASYAEETSAMVHALVRELGVAPSQIGLFSQDDAFGQAGVDGAVAALASLGFPGGRALPHGRYPRNTADVEGGLARLLDPRVDVRAVILVATYAPAARFIRLARENGLNAHFLAVSFVGSQPLAESLGADGEGVIVTEVVPDLLDTLPAVQEFRDRVAGERRSPNALEGYLAVRMFARGLELAGPGADREAWLDAVESGANLDPGLNARLSLSRDEHQLIHRVWPRVLRGGTFRALPRWSDLLGAE